MLITKFMLSALAGSMGTGPGPMNGLLSLGRAGEETCTDWEIGPDVKSVWVPSTR